jgi:hypothetical protein
MQIEEINAIAAAAEKDHKGNLTAAIGEFLGENFAGGVPVGFEAAHDGIKAEIEDLPNRFASENYDAAGGDNAKIAAALGVAISSASAVKTRARSRTKKK